MTEQPPSTAAPTPGPYYVHLPRNVAGGCRAIRTEKGRMHGTYGGTEVAYTVGLADDVEDAANAKLLAASWETAAERDRLVKVNERLVEALNSLVAAIDDLVAESNGVDRLHLNGDVAPWDELLPGGQYDSWLEAIDPARAALDEARKP